jgi:[ribosomal protein S5]-alanine N-acetyltransferase
MIGRRMKTVCVETPRLTLILQTPEEARASVAAMDEASKAQVSADWLARLDAAIAPDPFVHGFSLVRKDSGAVIGQCGFRGPPDADGMVEIAYGVSSDQEGNGFATEAARALRDYALTFEQVQTVRAHTLPVKNASQRILAKCGFSHMGEVADPQAGVVARFEYPRRR